jgi:hypothetical protein
MPANLEDMLISVWRQALVDNAKVVNVCGQSFPVERTSRSHLRELDFECEGQKVRGLEQNPNTTSNWARVAREGKKIMQFLSDRRYVADVVDGKVRFYDSSRSNSPR